MNTPSKIVPTHTNPTKIPHFIRDVSGKYCSTKPLTDKQIIKAATVLLNKKFIPGALLGSVDDTKTWLRIHYQDLEHEVFVCVFLNAQHCIISHDVLFRGTIDGASVYPREVVKLALKLNAAAVIFAHNHPSGFADPSPADKAITLKLKESLNLIDIRVLDHFILGKESAFSFAEHKLI